MDKFELEMIILDCLEKGRDLFIAGLNSDYKGDSWESITWNLQYADEVEILHGICEECGSFKGNHSERTDDSKEKVVIGDKNYRCLCNKCWTKGLNLNDWIDWRK